MRHIPLAVLCLGVLCGSEAAAQPTEQQNDLARPALRSELSGAAEHLAHTSPHPYGMSEEVARVRLQKMGFEKIDSLRAENDSTFEAQVEKNGQAQKVEIDRITGAIKTIR
jgi:Peptidase propeptide and YPEB domain